MDELERYDRIDALADRMLKTAPLEKSALEAWDEARDIIDAREHRRMLAQIEREQQEIRECLS
jgi:hypothetical protein